MGNEVILAAVKQALGMGTEYSLLVDYDGEGNAILMVAPAGKAAAHNR